MHRPTGPPWIQRCGHFLGVLPDKLGFLQQCIRDHGDVVDLSLIAPLRSTYLLNDPTDLAHVLQGNASGYAKTRQLTGPAGRDRSGSGLLTRIGDPALTQKRLLQPMMAKALMPRLAQIIDRSTEEILKGWSGSVDAVAQMSILARRILGQTLLSQDFSPDLDRAIVVRQRYIRRVYESIAPVRPDRHERGALRCIDDHLYREIARRRADPAEDLLSVFVAARYDDGSPMTDVQVRDEALTMTSTGSDTVALALSWALYLLAGRFEDQARLKDDSRPGLPFAERVFSEAMRLFPPTWIFVRVPLQDDVLPSGFRVRSGMTLFLSPYVTQRDGRFFKEPDRFDPARFEPEAVRGRPRLSYFPFSAGPRVCLGQAFAMLEGTRILAAVAERYRWDLQPGHDIRPSPGQFLFPSGPIRICLQS